MKIITMLEILSVLLIVAGGIVSGQMTPSKCIDNTTLNITENRCIAGECDILSRQYTCPNGCDNITNQCSPDSFNSLLYFTIPIAIVFIIIIAVIAWRIR